MSEVGKTTPALFAEVVPLPPLGMIALRGDLGSKAMAAAVKTAVGCNLPEVRRVEVSGVALVGWMAPDEVLVMVPEAGLAATLAALEKALAGQHALAVDVSDARLGFRLSGARAGQVLAKLCPIDIATLPEGELRRTRAAQVAVALWRSGADEITVLASRSVGAYLEGLLLISAQAGSELE